MRIPRLLKNKYFLTFLAFLVWILFFDNNNLVYQFRLSKKLKSLENQKEFYLSEVRKDSISIHHLTTNLDNLEKFARETYLMKKDNEEIYLIVREE